MAVTGTILDPILTSGRMTSLKSLLCLFAFWSLVNGTLAMMTFYLRKRETIEDVPIEDQVAFAPLKSTLPVAMALDPRSDAQVEDESGDSSYTRLELYLENKDLGSGQGMHRRKSGAYI